MSTTMWFPIALALLSIAAALVIAERILRHLRARKEPGEQDRTERREIRSLREELSAVNREYGRKRDIADRLPAVVKNFTERLPEDAYPSILVRSAKELFDASAVGYFRSSGDSSEFTLEVGTGFPRERQGDMRIASGEGLAGIAVRGEIVACRTDPIPSSGGFPVSRSLELAGIQSDFAAPVFGVSGILGVLVIAGCPHPLEEERKYVSMLADLCSSAMQRARSGDAGGSGEWKDDLTGLSTRIHFMKRFENEIRRTGNYRQSFALFLFDIDRFKIINDTYGHAAGDRIIGTVADIARKNTRSADLVGRYGGDEFLVLITAASEEQAMRFAEKIRNSISAADVRIGGIEGAVRLSISGGMALFPAHGQSVSELLHAADQALYEAKRKGRNRTVVARVPPLSPPLESGVLERDGAGSPAR